MTHDRWTEVDDYVTDLLIGEDAAMGAAVEASARAGLPSIQVTPNQGKLLHILARAMNARAILEIGTLGGYSTIWLARALPAGGRLVTLEVDPKHAEIARQNFERAGLASVIELRLGRAQETLPQLLAEGRAPFDLIFIDADKPGYPEYLEWALKLSRRGTLVVADNVVRDGAVVDSKSDDPNVRAVRRFNELLAGDRRVNATVIQTVGAKGYDGFAVALVTEGA